MSLECGQVGSHNEPSECQMLCRRRFVAELLMSLHDSPLADAQTRTSAMHALTAAAHLPGYAKVLMQRAGKAALLAVLPPVVMRKTPALSTCKMVSAPLAPI